jgi:hypothetical protein
MPDVPDNSRFGAINSRLRSSEFPFTARREFAGNLLLRRVFVDHDQRFRGLIRRIPSYFPNSREFIRFGVEQLRPGGPNRQMTQREAMARLQDLGDTPAVAHPPIGLVTQ